MSVVPSSKTSKVGFYNARLDPWSTNAVAIGTTTTAVTDLATKVATAQTKIEEQTAALAAAKTATMAANDAIKTMADAGADIIKSIRAKAAVVGNSVYELAEIPAPATPSPVVTLGKPTNFKVALGDDGALTLKWKCASPRASGTIYQVWRSTNGGVDFSYLGGTGSKTFVDSTAPAGSASLMYKIQAARSTATGPWATFTVLFGVASGGALTASVATSPRMAA